jgi:hypothetical protein
MEAGKKRLAGDTARAADTDEVNDLRPGFEDREFTRFSESYDITHRELKLLHVAMVYYEQLVYRHGLVQDRWTAFRWMRFKERQARSGAG